MNEKTNKMMKTVGGLLLTTTVTAVSTELIKPVIKTGVDVLNSKLQYVVDISYDIDMLSYGLKKLFPNYPVQSRIPRVDESYVNPDDLDIVTPNKWIQNIPYKGMINYKGTVITMHVSPSQSIGNHCSTQVSITLSVFNSRVNREKLQEFLRYITRLSKTEKMTDIKKNDSNIITITSGEGGANAIYHPYTKLRTFHDVFMPTEQRELLQDSIRAYVANHDWYIENNLPNHFGILLYSEAGHGKSSIAQAIADYVGAQLYVASGDDISYIENVINHIVGNTSIDASIYRVLLFEDVDSGLFNLNREHDKDDKNKEKKQVGLATILNYLDGMNAPSNIIYVFTTNHVEYLDPAFIRPGRCDLHLKIEGVIPETLQQFLDFHYPKENVSLPDGYEVKDGLTFAELQTHVMKGESASDIIKFAQKNA